MLKDRCRSSTLSLLILTTVKYLNHFLLVLLLLPLISILLVTLKFFHLISGNPEFNIIMGILIVHLSPVFACFRLIPNYTRNTDGAAL